MPLKGFGVTGNIFDLFTGMLNEAAQQQRDREREAERRRREEEERERERERNRLRQLEAQRVATLLEQERRRRRPKYDVVVVGCGAAGVAALARLTAAGVTAVGLEASDRMGGRINTVDFGAGVVDLGAAWCHGEGGNEVYRLAQRHNLLGRPNGDEELWYMLSNGTLIPKGNATTIQNTIDDAVDRTDKNNPRSISGFIRNEAYTVASSDGRRRPLLVTEPFIEWYERQLHLGGQDDPTKGKSLKGLEKHQPCPGEFWLNWKNRGYKTLLDVLMNKYDGTPLELNIQYSTLVENIMWQPLDVDPEYPFPVVDVKCANGTTIRARSVIVTVSLGFLKACQSLFLPPLPPSKINAIENLQFCVLDKIYIEFASAWWPESYTSFNILWRDEDKANFRDSEKWVTEIYGLRTVEYQPNVLLAWIYGEGAKKMERVSDGELRAGVDKLLEIFKLNFEVTPVRNVLRSKWASNLLARGSYSYRAVSTELSTASAEDLSVPLYNRGFPIVCFAGEATSHTQHGSVHGAVESGFREADRVKNLPRV